MGDETLQTQTGEWAAGNTRRGASPNVKNTDQSRPYVNRLQCVQLCNSHSSSPNLGNSFADTGTKD